jgi:ubiquinone/menaquinone biosynthesis C-methylase UbiE
VAARFELDTICLVRFYRSILYEHITTLEEERMKPTNYQRIAEQYDKNEVRQQVGKDLLLERMLAEHRSPPVRCLDLACGTGIYLNVQTEAFRAAPIEWHGFDASDAMLSRARQKAPAVIYAQGSAERLPYADNFFDLVTCHFAFHHFPEKARSLQEIRRVLNDNGYIKFVNIAPEDMPGWWLYAYFPQGVAIDLERFWPYKQLYHKLEALGFAVTCTITKTLSRVALAFVQRQVAPREISQLDLLGDEAFHQGLQRIAQDITEGATTMLDEFALLEMIGQKRLS